MTTTQQPSATLYILIPPSPLFAAHWSLFIHDPLNTDTRTESDKGRRITPTFRYRPRQYQTPHTHHHRARW